MRNRLTSFDIFLVACILIGSAFLFFWHFYYNKNQTKAQIDKMFASITSRVMSSHGICQSQNSFAFDIDGETIKYDAPPGYCAMDPIFVRNWFDRTGYIGIAAFYPCIEEDIDKGALNRVSSWIYINTPKEPERRNFKMSREQFLRESQTLLRTVIYGQYRATYYGDRQVPENFKRPTPLLLSCDSDEYAVYQSGPYFTVREGETIKEAKDQAVATTLIKGRVINITYSWTDFARTKSKRMLIRLKEYAKAFVDGNSALQVGG